MALFNLPTIGKKNDREFFLALLLKPFSVGSILFEEVDGKLLIISSCEKDLEERVEDVTEAQLLQYCDEVVSFVEQRLPQDTPLNKTIFALPYDFVEEGKIKKSYLAKFKKICEELELTPIGFIVMIEAIVHFLQKKEGVPLTAIFVELTKDSVYVYVVKQGAIKEVKSAKATTDLPKTVEMLLKGVHAMDVLPSKIILLSYDGVEETQQEFLSFPWTKDLPFLHLPQVTALEKGFENEAIINGVAMQMGFELPHTKNEGKAEETDSDVSKEEVEETGDQVQKKGEFEPEFGFVQDQDIRGNSIEDSMSEEQEVVQMPQDEEFNLKAHSEEYNKEEDHGMQKKKGLRGAFPAFSLPSFSLPQFKGGGLKLLLIPLVLVLLLAAFSYYYYNFLLKAEIVLFVSEKSADKTLDVALSSEDPTNPDKNIVSMNFVEIEKASVKTSATSGKKETGEKAKGEVVIYNKTDQKKTFEKGTVLVGPNKLEFELSDEVSVASTSAFSTNFSNTKAKVTALKFGSEYNIPSESNFIFKSSPSSSYIAKSGEAFSGGKKEDIAVVSKKDLQTLEDELVEELKQEALPELQSKKGDEVVLIEDVNSAEFIEKKFDKKEGEEAKNVKLTARVKFRMGGYSKEELNKFLVKIAEREMPDGYNFVEDQSKVELRDVQVNKDGNVTAQLVAKAYFLPSVKPEDVIMQVKGKNVSSAQEEIGKIKNITEAKIILKNNVPLFPEFVPFNTKNVTLTVNTNG